MLQAILWLLIYGDLIKMKKSNFSEHFYELKKRVIYCFIFFIISFLVSYNFSKIIYSFLSSPLIEAAGEHSEFIYTNIAEAFFVKLDISFKFALLLTSPIILLQIYLFIKPGLYKHERNLIKSALICVPSLFILGTYFVYNFVMPNAFKFFISFENDFGEKKLYLLAKINEYTSLVTSFIFAFGIAFQLPILLLIFVSLKLINSKNLRENRRISIVIIFTISAILTPPDILSQFLLAIPLFALYELTIYFAVKLEKWGNSA